MAGPPLLEPPELPPEEPPLEPPELPPEEPPEPPPDELPPELPPDDPPPLLLAEASLPEPPPGELELLQPAHVSAQAKATELTTEAVIQERMRPEVLGNARRCPASRLLLPPQIGPLVNSRSTVGPAIPSDPFVGREEPTCVARKHVGTHSWR